MHSCVHKLELAEGEDGVVAAPGGAAAVLEAEADDAVVVGAEAELGGGDGDDVVEFLADVGGGHELAAVLAEAFAPKGSSCGGVGEGIGRGRQVPEEDEAGAEGGGFLGLEGFGVAVGALDAAPVSEFPLSGAC